MEAANLAPTSAGSPHQAALDLLPSTLAVLCAGNDQRRTGLIVESALWIPTEPPTVAVALRAGHRIEPLIRDTRAFALCPIHAGDRLLLKRFGAGARESADPFDCFRVERLATGSPCLTRAQGAIDCELIRHIDLDMGMTMYVGRVLASRRYDGVDTSASRLKASLDEHCDHDSLLAS
ncbi:MAG: flavin reductase family protein [Phycisphaerales bacterium]